MRFLLFFFGICLSTNLFSQANLTTIQYGDFTMELDERIQNLLVARENVICPTIVDTIIPVAEYCAGARIQVFYSKNRSEAESVLREIKAKFPHSFSSLDYNAPDYKVKLGYFDSRSSAQSELQKVRRSYRSSLIVDERVRCSMIQ